MDNLEWVLLLFILTILSFVGGTAIERQKQTKFIETTIQETSKDWKGRFSAIIKNSSPDCVLGFQEIMEAYDNKTLD